MLFNSQDFLFLFLPVVLIIFFLLRRFGNYRLCQVWIIVSSLFFYTWTGLGQLPFLLGSVVFNFGICTLLQQLHKGSAPSPFLSVTFWIGIMGNLGLLIYCKYAGWLLDNLLPFIGTINLPASYLQPLGISFFTMTQIMLLVDAYEGMDEPMDFLQYTTFITFFPCLLSGPILQHSDTLSLFSKKWLSRPQAENIMRGIALFAIGLVKKVVIADSFASWVTIGFERAASLTLVEAWIVAFSFTLQLYFDFSGYTDMAVGIGRILGIELPINFNTPLRAKNLIEFWQRWHITLSSFITGYVYIPILRSFPRITLSYSFIAILMAMLISGLWHGASWTFVLWGGLHGLAIVINHLWAKSSIRLADPIAWGATLLFIVIAFVIFRAKNIDVMFTMFQSLLGQHGVMLPAGLSASLGFLADYGVTFGSWLGHIDPVSPNRPILWVIVFLILAVFFSNSNEIVADLEPTTESALLIALLMSLGISYMLAANRITDFLYFQF